METKIYNKLNTNSSAPNDAFSANLKAVILELIYPIGSIYMSRLNNDNPGVIFGFVLNNFR